MVRERSDLLDGERVIMESDAGLLTLTNYRVRFDVSTASASRYLTITLNSVASAGVVTRSYPILLGLAALAAIGSLTQHADDRAMLIVFAVLLGVAYVLSRRALLTISSHGGEAIRVPARAMGRAAIVEFVDALDGAKVAMRRETAATGHVGR